MNNDRRGLVVLVNPGWVGQPYTVFPNYGLLAIGTYLQNHGFSVELIDANSELNYRQRLNSLLVRKDLLFLGITAMTVNVPHAFEIAEEAKKINPEVPVVWGGPHATLFPESTLRSPVVDIVAIGDSLTKALKLAVRISSGQFLEGIKGIGFKSKGKTVLNYELELDNIEDYPVVDYSLIDIERYIAKYHYFNKIAHYNPKQEYRSIPLLTGLGCAYKCAFCIHSIMKQRYRWKPANKIAEEIKELQKKYLVDSFVFFDENFFLNKKRISQLLDIFELEKIKIRWRAISRADIFVSYYGDCELLSRLEKNGLSLLFIGAESGSQRVLDFLKKGITVEHVLRSVELLKDTKIIPEYTFMVFVPGETYQEMLETFSLAAKIKLGFPRAIVWKPYIYRLYPGGEIFNNLILNYRINLPDTLEDWASSPVVSELFKGRTKPPWIKGDTFKTCMNINDFYLSVFLSYFDRKNSHLNLIEKGLLEIVHKIVTTRFSKKWFRLPFEPVAYKLYKRLKRTLRS